MPAERRQKATVTVEIASGESSRDGSKSSKDKKPSSSEQATTTSTKKTVPGKGKSGKPESAINALLSLGRDLGEGETGETADATETEAAAPDDVAGKKEDQSTSSATPVPILPATDGDAVSGDGVPPNKKQKVGDEGKTNDPSDFWYWLPEGDIMGEWDVLCGRGGESNNYVGNRKYRKVVNERKPAYRAIPLKQRKNKTAFVRSIVQHVNNCGGRFLDVDEKTGRYYVVTLEKARRKTSQALRETKELKWLEIEEEPKPREAAGNKNSTCPFCKKKGHKTKIAKACLLHHEWLATMDTKGKGASISGEVDAPRYENTTRTPEKKAPDNDGKPLLARVNGGKAPVSPEPVPKSATAAV